VLCCTVLYCTALGRKDVRARKRVRAKRLRINMVRTHMLINMSHVDVGLEWSVVERCGVDEGIGAMEWVVGLEMDYNHLLKHTSQQQQQQQQQHHHYAAQHCLPW